VSLSPLTEDEPVGVRTAVTIGRARPGNDGGGVA
jgi:hypothetical protein